SQHAAAKKIHECWAQRVRRPTFVDLAYGPCKKVGQLNQRRLVARSMLDCARFEQVRNVVSFNVVAKAGHEFLVSVLVRDDRDVLVGADESSVQEGVKKLDKATLVL